MRGCVPALISHFTGATINPRLLEVTELVGLKCLLSDERSQWLSVLSRVSAVAAWVKAAPTDESQQHRINAFADLVTRIDFNAITPLDCVGLLCDEDLDALPSSCKCVPRSSLIYSDSVTSHQQLLTKCLTNFTCFSYRKALLERMQALRAAPRLVLHRLFQRHISSTNPPHTDPIDASMCLA